MPRTEARKEGTWSDLPAFLNYASFVAMTDHGERMRRDGRRRYRKRWPWKNAFPLRQNCKALFVQHYIPLARGLHRSGCCDESNPPLSLFRFEPGPLALTRRHYRSLRVHIFRFRPVPSHNITPPLTTAITLRNCRHLLRDPARRTSSIPKPNPIVIPTPARPCSHDTLHRIVASVSPCPTVFPV